MSTDQPALRVFISSTVEDLGDHRQAVKGAVLDCGFQPVVSEHWPATSCQPVAECRQRVSGSNVFVIIVAHRYGSVPQEQSGGEWKSMTRLEYEQARDLKIPILAFIVDPEHHWPDEYRDNSLSGVPTEDNEKIARTNALNQFKELLRTQHTCVQFTTAEDLKSKVLLALTRQWRPATAREELVPHTECITWFATRGVAEEDLRRELPPA